MILASLRFFQHHSGTMNRHDVMKKFGFCAIFCAGLSLQACITMTAATPAPEYTGMQNPYAGVVGHEYQALAVMMNVNGDDAIAERFRYKAGAADAGFWAYPDVVPENAPEELIEAEDSLNAALGTAMNDENALWLARAQVNYDCWLNTTMMAAGSPLLDGCRRDYEKAMRGISLPEGMLQTQSVFFGTDSSALDETSHAMLANLGNLLRMNHAITVRLVGSTERKNNHSMALRRAIAVRNALAQQGVSPDRIIVAGEDHSDTILSQQNTETGTDPQSRRVDIMLDIIDPVLERGQGA